MAILIVDNYDSFTYNLVHYVGELGTRPVVRRNDKVSLDEVAAMDPEAIIISPGPCTPEQAGICLPLIARFGAAVPILGVCLGHEAVGQAYGAAVVRAPHPMHGKLSSIRHNGRSLFRGINGDFQATRYHSLMLDPKTVPPALEVTATAEDGVIMAVMHGRHPVHGVQFHPESIASDHGHLVLRNFLDMAADWNAGHRIARSVA